MPRTWSPLLDLHLADRVVSTAIVVELERLGLEPSFLALLAVIRDRGRVTPTELYRTMGFQPSTCRDMTRMMIANGHVHRVENPDDGRSHFLELTPAGEAFVEEAWVAVRAVERKVGPVMRNLSEPLREVYAVAYELANPDALSVD